MGACQAVFARAPMENRMTYDELVTRLAHRTGLHSEVVKKVLVYLPDVLRDLPMGDNVRTPLGVFRMTKRKTRPITLPDGTTQALVQGMTVVKLRPGSRLQVED